MSRYEVRPVQLSGIPARLVRESHEIRPSDDVVLFCGRGMARYVERFSAELVGAFPPAVVLAPWLDWEDVSLALDLGVTSYLLENRYGYLLGEALLCTAQGASILDPVIAAEQVRAARQARRKTDGADVGEGPGAAPPGRLPQLPQLSQRETQIMNLLSGGHSMSEVARETCLTERTVRNYLSRIYAKLGVRCRSEAILFWLGRLNRPDAVGPAGHRKRDGSRAVRDADR